MSTIVWEFRGSEITSINREGDNLVLQLAPFFLLKSLAGSIDQTRWKQQGQLLIKQATLSGSTDPVGTVRSGQLTHNAFVYRDEVPMPVSVQGEVSLRLKLEGVEDELVIDCELLELQPQGLEKYVAHISK
ncbi:MAG TPA: hypothetical protein ENI64_01785 [Gammaproteobacteria bacterium]|nr:hypothetical protein [Gammaproteobacteria bacterium]